MRFSEAKGHKVVSSSTAGTIGKVNSFVVDPATRSVVALKLKKTENGDFLRWADLTAFGADAVTVSDPATLGDGGDDVLALADKAHRLLGKRVLTSGGDTLGKVEDVEFAIESGLLTTIIVSGAPEVAAERLLGVGSFAVVVREEP